MTRRSTVVQPGRVPLAALLLVALAATATLVASTAKDLYTAALTDGEVLVHHPLPFFRGQLIPIVGFNKGIYE